MEEHRFREEKSSPVSFSEQCPESFFITKFPASRAPSQGIEVDAYDLCQPNFDCEPRDL